MGLFSKQNKAEVKQAIEELFNGTILDADYVIEQDVEEVKSTKSNQCKMKEMAKNAIQKFYKRRIEKLREQKSSMEHDLAIGEAVYNTFAGNDLTKQENITEKDIPEIVKTIGEKKYSIKNKSEAAEKALDEYTSMVNDYQPKMDNIDKKIEELEEKINNSTVVQKSAEEDTNEKVQNQEIEPIQNEEEISNEGVDNVQPENNQDLNVEISNEEKISNAEENIEEEQQSVEPIVNNEVTEAIANDVKDIIKNDEIKEVHEENEGITEVTNAEDIFTQTFLEAEAELMNKFNILAKQIFEDASKKALDTYKKSIVNITLMAEEQIKSVQAKMNNLNNDWQVKYSNLEKQSQEDKLKYDQEINELNIALDNNAKIVEAKNNEINSNNEIINQNNQDIANLKEEVSLKDKEIQSRDILIAEKDNEIERLKVFETRFKLMAEAMAPISNEQEEVVTKTI